MTTLNIPHTGTQSYELMLSLMQALTDNGFQAELTVNAQGITLRTDAPTHVVNAGKDAIVAQSRQQRTFSLSLTFR